MEKNQPQAPHRGGPRFGPSPQPANRHPDRPWRTEGLPGGDGDDEKSRRSRWRRAAVVMFVFYGLVFALLTWQDAASGPVTISYTAFSEQV